MGNGKTSADDRNGGDGAEVINKRYRGKLRGK
jgi:hypothetical protein